MPNKMLKWQDPLKFAEKISYNYGDRNWAFLYSSLNKSTKNSYSYIALFPKKEIVSDDFLSILEVTKKDQNKWFGFLSYELAQDFEKLPKTKKSFINLPKIWLINFSLILEFNHDKKTLRAVFDNNKYLDEVLKYKALSKITSQIKVKDFYSNFSDESYLSAIEEIKKMIADGDFYQTNLTRKFFGKFSQKQTHQNNFELFSRLAEASPANYSSFLKFGKNSIISSSPELFLKIENNDTIISRPIKGTAARSENLAIDKKNKLNLQNSVKEKAENLMIVDLVRNDLARICKAGTVVVKNLFNITSYKTIHHMSSEIHGKIDKNFTIKDILLACFPAGSMTGAPKIKAMEIIAKKEKVNRGIYSGAIGYLSSSSANLAVVIRTLILQDDKFEFQVGGAITFDSKPKSELKEIFSKAKAIKKLLKLNFNKSIEI